MSILSHLEPNGVFRHFEDLCAIPHGSGNTDAIAAHLTAFAAARGLEHRRDALNNVIIFKKAAPGYEAAESVILQGHVDMVCEKAPGCNKDMALEGLDLAIDGDAVYAVDTTLGGDDGIAVAMMLALLESDLPHPALECVFTADEEVGMPGAQGIDVSDLQGRRMLNIDSEAEGIFTVSCAGGSRVRCRFPVARESCAWSAVSLRVGGLGGGHSGVEIDRGRANAISVLGRVLDAVADKTALRLVSLSGGGKENAIPSGAEAVICAEDAAAAMEAVAAMEELLKVEYSAADPGITVTAAVTETALTAMDEATTVALCAFLLCAPCGVQEMSRHIPGLVQTSLNFGVLDCGEEEAVATFLLRSSVESQKHMLERRVCALAGRCGGTAEIGASYPGWLYLENSPLRELLKEIFQEQYGYAPKIEAIHAGLECGLFAGKLPGLDCVSIGPDLTEIHTPRERMSISSVQRVWAMVTEALRRMKD